MLQFMGLQKVGHDLATEQQQTPFHVLLLGKLSQNVVAYKNSNFIIL